MKKIALISRGIPGSGKSTFNRILTSVCEEYNINIAIHSTDDRFMVDGKYVFDFTKLHAYHMDNLRDFTSSVMSNISVVVVDNTNIKARDYKPYIEVAKNNGYHVVSVILQPDDITKHFSRQSHGVPFDKLELMKNSLITSGATIGTDRELIISPLDFNVEFLRGISMQIID